MKKVVSLVVTVIVVLSVILFVKQAKRPQNQLLHKSIIGTILSYQQKSDGLTIVLDDIATSSDKVILITEDTMFRDNLLKQNIFDMKTGLCVEVESEFWTQTYDGVYTAILITSTDYLVEDAEKE